MKTHFCLLNALREKKLTQLFTIVAHAGFLKYACSRLLFIELLTARLVAWLDGRLPSHTGDGRRIALSAAAGSLQTPNCFVISFISISICTLNEMDEVSDSCLLGFSLANFTPPLGSYTGKRHMDSVSCSLCGNASYLHLLVFSLFSVGNRIFIHAPCLCS